MHKTIFTVCIGTFIFCYSAFAAHSQCDLNKKLGVSRTIELDAQGGPAYGIYQYKRTLPLRDKEVILTFDDGPHPVNTINVLKALKDHCTKATFFAVGSMALKFPKTLQQVAAHGHTIGAHTHSHPRMPDLAVKNAKIEIERGFAEVIHATGHPIAPFFRFPGLRDSKYLNTYLKTRNITSLSVDIVSGDTKNTATRAIVSQTMRLLKRRKRGIILLHDLKATTARAVPVLLNELKRKGYKIVHLVPKRKITTALYTLPSQQQPASSSKTKIRVADKRNENEENVWKNNIWEELGESFADLFDG